MHRSPTDVALARLVAALALVLFALGSAAVPAVLLLTPFVAYLVWLLWPLIGWEGGGERWPWD